jgi:hypothetical protein
VTADPKLAARYQKFIVNRLRFFDPNDDPDVEIWPVYTKDSPKVMVLGHKTSSGRDYDWKLENDPMSAYNQANCDSLQASAYEAEPNHELPALHAQRPSRHLEMI